MAVGMKKQKKRTKAFNPNKHRINSLAGLNVIKKHQPLTIDEQRELCQSAVTSLNAMQFAIDLSPNDFTILCDVINISLVFTERGLGKEYLDELYAARDALQRSKMRFLDSGKLGFFGPDLDTMKFALKVHNWQLERCGFGMFESAYETQNARIKAGNYYKSESERLAA